MTDTAGQDRHFGWDEPVNGQVWTRDSLTGASTYHLEQVMSECTVEPADFDACPACYAYQIVQQRGYPPLPSYVDPMDPAALLARATRFEFGDYRSEEPLRSFTVQWRGEDTWAICFGMFGDVVNNRGEVEHEMRNSERTDKFRARTRFPFDVAMRIATELEARIGRRRLVMPLPGQHEQVEHVVRDVVSEVLANPTR